jgi:hypothetical protein
LLKDLCTVQYEKPCHFCSYIDAWRGYIWSMLPHPPRPKRPDEPARTQTQAPAEVVELRAAKSAEEPRRTRSRS